MKLRALPTVAVAAALLLSGCSTNTASEGGNAQVPTGDIRTWAEIQQSGVLHVGTITDYPPNEFKTAAGEPTGWAVELVEEIAAELGLTVEYELLLFDNILPRIQGGVIDLGVGSFTDTPERQEVVDFVNYYEAGSLWATLPGSGITPDTACGATVAAMTGGTQLLFELPERSEQCVAQGKEPIEITQYVGQPEVTNAVLMGQADAFTADSPVAIDAVSALDGKLEITGEIFDTAPYGFPVGKGGDLAPHVRDALQAIIDDGRYAALLAKYNSEAGAISQAGINLATQ